MRNIILRQKQTKLPNQLQLDLGITSLTNSNIQKGRCLIDTGCDLNLVIPDSARRNLQLKYLGSKIVKLADENMQVKIKQYEAQVYFNSFCENADFIIAVSVLEGNQDWVMGLGLIDLFCNLNKAYFVIDIVEDEVRFEAKISK